METKEKETSLLKSAFLATIPIMTGYLVLGLGFGMILESRGFGFLWAFAMGAFIYAGSMQYLAIDLLTGGASLLATALATLMVNARHLFYGISMIEPYKNTGKKKPYLMFALTDETYSLVCQNYDLAPEDKHKYFFYVSLLNQIYWVSGCTLGGLLGEVLTINIEGIDFALTALFVTVFVEQWLSTKNHAPALVGLIVTVICLVIFGSEIFLIPSMIGITLVLTLLNKRGIC